MGLQFKSTPSLLLCVMGVAALLGLGLLGYALTSSVSAESNSAGCTSSEEVCDIRLNPKVLPKHYELYLHPNIEEGTFSGKVTINITLLEAVNHIRLHVQDLKVTDTTLKREDDSFLSVEGHENPELEYWIVKQTNISAKPFSIGNYQLSLVFNGSLTTGIVGLYRSSYNDPRDDTNKFVVSTKFQPTFARRAFPCFDEPGFKSTFSLSLVKPSSLVAISNMPVQTELADTPSKGLTTVNFAPSVPMVTYLLALTIGDLSYLETRSKRGVPVRIYATSFQIKRGEFASSITAGILDFYEDYFGIPYPLPKMDIVGVPDFVSGAMEHWGMITFRESNLMYQPGVGSAANKQRIASVIAHELAHMWFGNLMTIKWWDDLWLNEGFASYIEYKDKAAGLFLFFPGVGAVRPEWEIESQFVIEDLVGVLGLDGQLSSHPIVQEVKHPNQITELFDKISYAKGASVIRMLESFMGPSAFRAGVSSFLQKFSYGNAETKDLWEYLQRHADKNAPFNITLVMDTWTRQMGYPLISPEKRTDGTWILRQQRFLDDRDSATTKKAGPSDKSPYGYRWEVPVGLEWPVGSGRGVNQTINKMIWMNHDSDTVTLPVDPTSPWIKLNKGGFGYYRVMYPDDMYSGVKSDVMSSFTPQERCGLIDDAYVLAYSYYLNYNVALDFSTFLKKEEHVIPWACARNNIGILGRLFQAVDPDDHVLFKKYILDLVSNKYEKLSWIDAEDDPHFERLMKPLIFSLACDNGHKGCLSKTKELFSRWIADPDSPSTQISSGLRDLVYKWGMYQSGEQEWNRLLSVMNRESDSQERIRHLRSLCNVQDVAILKNLLELAKNESLVRQQDYFSVFQFYSGNPLSNKVIWDYYRAEYENLVKRFGLNDRTFGRSIAPITYSFATDERLKEVEEFFIKYPKGGAGTRAREASLENIRTNIAWAKKNAAGIKAWLRKTYLSL